MTDDDIRKFVEEYKKNGGDIPEGSPYREGALVQDEWHQILHALDVFCDYGHLTLVRRNDE